MKQLDLRGNGITELAPRMFFNLWSLQTLLLNHNKIRQLTYGVFQGLANLERLEFEECAIETIEPNTFLDTPSLEVLNLCDNSLGALEEKVINIPTLQHLSLDGNGLRALPRDLSLLTSLTHLDVSYNNLSTLEHCQFASLLALQYLNIRENRFVCDCNLFWVRAIYSRLWRQWDTTSMPPFVSDRCLYPKWLRGIFVEQQHDHNCLPHYTTTYEQCRYYLDD